MAAYRPNGVGSKTMRSRTGRSRTNISWWVRSAGWAIALVACSAIAANAAAYLDPCTAPGDCSSGLCVEDLGGDKFCSRSCAAESECADEHVCAGSQCVPDDTGTLCTQPSDCASGLCLISAGLCTRACTSGLDCPAGSACSNVSGQKVCLHIEKPCAGAASCPTGLCLSGLGCTAACDTSADCPQRFPWLPAYSCAFAFGSPSKICVPPIDVMGSDPIGTSCPVDPNTCRSGVCNTAAPTPVCTQSCNAQGGCGPGFGCVPEESADVLLCSGAGSGSLGESCAGPLDCLSGLCEGSVCTRLCQDGLCPSGFTCSAASPPICVLPEPRVIVALLAALPFAAALSRRRRSTS
jgi:hypothetical protein